MSLFGLLNKGKTAAGSRLLSQWIKQPLLDAEAIGESYFSISVIVNGHLLTSIAERRLNFVELFKEDIQLRQDVQNQLKNTPDLERFARKFEKGTGNLEVCCLLFYFLLLALLTISLFLVAGGRVQVPGSNASSD